MHRALYLPEIVTAIVRAGKTEPGFLYSCLLVNKLFCHEACRILWKGCYGIFGVSHVTPKISDLAHMVLRAGIGPERAQFYANFIRVLVFQQDEFTREDDARWHFQLRKLQFPLLEDLNIWKTESAESSNTEQAILHYVHPGLRDIRIDASARLSDYFLDELSRLCPQLQQLDIDFKNVTISKQGLTRFLQRMSSLQGVHVAALDKSWSVEGFIAVAKYERLTLLHVPAIEETWFDALQLVNVSRLFPELQYFYSLNTSGKALRRLHAINPRLQAVHLYNSSLLESEDVLQAAARFAQLTNFRYQPGLNAEIQGQELLHLARSCSQIKSLSIGQDQTPPPTAVGMSDDIIRSLAGSLQLLQELYLIYESSSPPSIASILSAFSQHCPLLNQLEITCGSDWDVFANSRTAFSFLNLWTITLHPQAHMEDVLTEPDFGVLFTCFQEFAEDWFPKVEFFNIEDADDWEQQLNDHMYHVGYKREYGSEFSGAEEGAGWNESDGEENTAGELTEPVAGLHLSDN
ncbi:hypothetical protein SVAN01_11610 [Stagonosporopsis vannaccii]|nr:hypothetical protein SVAN01_11610 [Stagonosporopsis vannaccii]